MYTLLLVDDEEEVIEAIVKKVKWEELGFQVTGHANNGFKAMDMLEEMQPDVVMTDIRMPVYGRAGIVCAYKSKVSGNKKFCFLPGLMILNMQKKPCILKSRNIF